MGLIIWLSAFFSIIIDNVFKDYYTLTPLYFLLESVYKDKSCWKIMRLILFSTFYQSFSYQELNFLWLIITFTVIMIELYREFFYYAWSASLIQIAIFLLPYYWNYPFSLLYGFTIDGILFIYAYRKLELGGA
ncbi:MAG: hypothetical protein ACK4MM_03935 [Fervidobacterium sp.]